MQRDAHGEPARGAVMLVNGGLNRLSVCMCNWRGWFWDKVDTIARGFILGSEGQFNLSIRFSATDCKCVLLRTRGCRYERDHPSSTGVPT